MSRVDFLNIRFDNLTVEEALASVSRHVEEDRGGYAVLPNVDSVVKLDSDPEFKRICDEADLVLVDGQILVWLSRLFGRPLREKINGSDLFPRLCELAARKGYTMFFLGAAEGVAAAAAKKLAARYPGLNVVGTYSPRIGFERDREEIARIISHIRRQKVNILIIGLGAPKQEKFYCRHREALGVSFALGLGASIDFEAGVKKRAPRWMSGCGLEWFYRMCQEPGRLMKRYLVDDMRIIPLLFKYRRRE